MTATESRPADPLIIEPDVAISEIVARSRGGFDSGANRELDRRKEHLRSLDLLLVEGEDELVAALAADFAKPEYEAFVSDIAVCRAEIRTALSKLDRWARPRRVTLPLVEQPGRARIVPEPIGVVLVMAPWNYPVQLLVNPIAAAIAAGNTVIAKPSELTPAVSTTVAALAARHLDPEVIAIVEGGVDEATELLEQRFDHIFFTGSGRVARTVMEAAAKHLTPVTLELGGKSPVIVDRSADIDVAARRIAWGKSANAGQTCVAPDYVLAHWAIASELSEKIGQAFAEFYGSAPERSDDLAAIVNDHHRDRIVSLFDDLPESFGRPTTSGRKIAPTIVFDPPADSPLLKDEIFGPILPIVPVDSMEEATDFVNERDKPLALYVFSSDDDVTEQVLGATSSGSVLVNHTLLQAASTVLPFGGVGPSGMGSYHGRHGFDRLSHLKPVLTKPTRIDPKFLYPPYTSGKLKTIRKLLTR